MEIEIEPSTRARCKVKAVGVANCSTSRVSDCQQVTLAGNIGALIISYTILGVHFYSYWKPYSNY